MKPSIYFFTLLLTTGIGRQEITGGTRIAPRVKHDTCWTGSLNGKTPIFIHYQVDGNVVIGEITYLNTKRRLPIRLLGTIEEDKSYRLLEFDNSGNITGVIEGQSTGRHFNGSWSPPHSKKELVMKLSLNDSLINSPDIQPDKNRLYGNYHYQYGEKGYSGDVDIQKAGVNKIAFHIISFTNIERGPNIAEVEKDTILLKDNGFTYTIPNSDHCCFKTSFYKDFICIRYTNGYCAGQFGLNATIDGIFVKTN